MSVRWIAGLSFIYITATIVSLTIEGAWLGAEDVSFLNLLTGISIMDVGGIAAIPKITISFFVHGLPKIISWNYPWFTGSFMIIRIVMSCFSGVIIWGLIQLTYPAMQGVISRFIR